MSRVVYRINQLYSPGMQIEPVYTQAGDETPSEPSSTRFTWETINNWLNESPTNVVRKRVWYHKIARTLLSYKVNKAVTLWKAVRDDDVHICHKRRLDLPVMTVSEVHFIFEETARTYSVVASRVHLRRDHAGEEAQTYQYRAEGRSTPHPSFC